MNRVGRAAEAPAFPVAARKALGNAQLRRNVRHATDVIRAKRAAVAGEMPDWEALRDAAHEIKDHTLRHLDFYLEQFETHCTRAGGRVHWARDADEANRIIIDIVRRHGGTEVIKMKTMTSDETQLNEAFEAAGIRPYETDLAELIIQLGHDTPSHIVCPSVHWNRNEVRELFREAMHLPDLGNDPADLTEAARQFLRALFMRVPVGLSGGNFAVADAGSICVVESEGNGRMCVTLPRESFRQWWARRGPPEESESSSAAGRASGGGAPDGVELVPDHQLENEALDATDGVLTGCTAAIALTGSIVLTHTAAEGRRALTLVPDYHLCVIREDQVVETVSEALARARAESPSVLTTIAGPSATADIEMTRIKGVHGPRTLEVILLG